MVMNKLSDWKNYLTKIICSNNVLLLHICNVSKLIEHLKQYDFSEKWLNLSREVQSSVGQNFRKSSRKHKHFLIGLVTQIFFDEK